MDGDRKMGDTVAKEKCSKELVRDLGSAGPGSCAGANVHEERIRLGKEASVGEVEMEEMLDGNSGGRSCEWVCKLSELQTVHQKLFLDGGPQRISSDLRQAAIAVIAV